MRAMVERLQGRTALVTTSEWFFAPDGNSYRAAFGTLHGIHTDEATLGIRTNARSTNWYLEIGGMVIAGCQVHYVVRCDGFDPTPPIHEGTHDGIAVVSAAPMTRIFNADTAGVSA